MTATAPESGPTPTQPTGAHIARPESSTVGEAAKAVAEDIGGLVRAEINMAKAEAMQGVQAKATGAGMLVGTAALAWLGLQGLLIAAGFALALVVPAWAAALIVAAALFVIGAVLALIARRQLQAPIGIDDTKEQARQDVDWTKEHLQAPRTTTQVREDIAWTTSRLTGR